MNLTELSSSDKESYNRFVAESPSGSFSQSWEWGEWQSALGRQVKRLKWKAESGETAAVIQLIKMPLPFGKYYLYAPYGWVTGKIGESNFAKATSDRSENRRIGNLIIEKLREKFRDSVFIRVEPKFDLRPPTSDLRLKKTVNIQPAKTLLIDLTKSENQLLAEMHHKTRYNIKVAQKHEVEVKDEFDVSVGHGLFFDEALKLILETSRRQKFNTFPVSYYKKLADFFTLHNRGDLKLHIYKAVFSAGGGSASGEQNQLLAAAIMVDFGTTRTFLFGGSSYNHKNVMAPYLLHWQAMLDAKNLGLSAYDFWGVETSVGDVPGFVRFKLGFGPQSGSGILQYPGAYDLINSRFGYWVYKHMRRLNRVLKKSSA